MKKDLVAISILVFLIAGGLTAGSSRPTFAAVDFRVLVQQHVDALNRGDVAGVMATFSEDAMVSNVGLCAATPCIGKAAIQREMERRAGIHVNFKIVSLRESNGSGVGRAEITADNTRACGIQRILASFDVQVKDDQITSFPVRFDSTDPQTAAFMACVAAPAASVSPPRTGDGGLLEANKPDCVLP